MKQMAIMVIACLLDQEEVACIYTEGRSHPFYTNSSNIILSEQVDAKGRKLKKFISYIVTKKPCYLQAAASIDAEGSILRKRRSNYKLLYLNFLNLVNLERYFTPQYGDENDALAVGRLRLCSLTSDEVRPQK